MFPSGLCFINVRLIKSILKSFCISNVFFHKLILLNKITRINYINIILDEAFKKAFNAAYIVVEHRPQCRKLNA